jgi:alpha-L-glutamate ligase-like protein
MGPLSPKRFRDLGVLGMNRRNFELIHALNPRASYPLVDDKLRTKRLVRDHGICVPEVYCVIDRHHQLQDIESRLEGRDDFVVKPARGAAGDGILVVERRLGGGSYRTASGKLKSIEDLRQHLANILSGMYSLSAAPDSAFFEYRIKPDETLGKISFQGVPDVRVVVYRGYPAFSMVRLPTAMADGKANLHQGAVGAGVDIGTGKTSSGVWKRRRIREHPDTGCSIEGVEVPHWPRLLEIAAGCFDLIGMGYLGVDLVLDEDHGPMMLELNARPGLDIQIANRRGLREVLAKVDAFADEPRSPAERVDMARSHLGDGAWPY